VVSNQSSFPLSLQKTFSQPRLDEEGEDGGETSDTSEDVKPFADGGIAGSSSNGGSLRRQQGKATGPPSTAENYEPMLERLSRLENNFSLLLSRGEIEAYASLDEALKAPSRFSRPVDVKLTDPIVVPKPGKVK